GEVEVVAHDPGAVIHGYEAAFYRVMPRDEDLTLVGGVHGRTRGSCQVQSVMERYGPALRVAACVAEAAGVHAADRHYERLVPLRLGLCARPGAGYGGGFQFTRL